MRFATLLLLLAAGCLAEPPLFVRVPSTSVEMGATEITVAQFAAFVKATGYRTAAEREQSRRTWRVPGFALHKNQPVTYVSANDASKYCEFIGARLPTEAEWELAARAGSTTRHYWGESLDARYLWYRANSGQHPNAAGRKRPNAWGLFDMEGNVWEWTLAEPEKGELIACRRGGSWIDCEDIDLGPGKTPVPLIGLSVRFKIPVRMEHRYDDIGFRCLRAVDARATILGSKWTDLGRGCFLDSTRDNASVPACLPISKLP